MSATQARSAHRWARIFSSTGTLVGIVAALGVGPLACAGRHRISEAPPHPIAVEVENNLTITTELTVYISEDQGGSRRMLGTVPGAQTKTFIFTPYAWGQTYRFVGVRPLSGPIASPSFTLGDADIGTITWSVIPNQVQFYGGADTTTTPPPTPAPAPSH